MGRGDKKTKKGKRFSRSYGILRPRKIEVEKYISKPKKVVVVEETALTEEVKETKKTVVKKKSTSKKTTKKKS
ncbi:MAG: 30S ribosomal protein THX [Flavobacteriales bacterium]|mgnify:FL=1|jgi:ribosomal small subunit protein bTHX|nr:30S ribosomal protein THX [Flavobacteriales bacterium]MBT6013723.1 30S ribosomal protein THX [Flavobacteriales bacterium]MBT7480956.1 30S ribosomal protein THX [Flavobacteriales bacterium]